MKTIKVSRDKKEELDKDIKESLVAVREAIKELKETEQKLISGEINLVSISIEIKGMKVEVDDELEDEEDCECPICSLKRGEVMKPTKDITLGDIKGLSAEDFMEQFGEFLKKVSAK